MAPRTSARSLASSSSTPTIVRASSALPQPTSTASPQLVELRRQWKWAAVSQFLYTFAALVALDDITVVDVEEDLVVPSMRIIPRLMHRLLYTLTQDRKISLDNWQTALRKQYLKRNPEANPLGSEPQLPPISLAVTPELDSQSEDAKDDFAREEHNTRSPSTEHSNDVKLKDSLEQSEQRDTGFGDMVNESRTDASLHLSSEPTADNPVNREGDTELTDSKDWAQLTMLEKLDSLHTLMEWHFSVPTRLRTIMRSDDDIASWRIEPIGFDAKHNAYWLIGLDRLWIQREPPKPPRKNLKRKSTTGHGARRSKTLRATSITDSGSGEREKPSQQKKISKGMKDKLQLESPGKLSKPARSSALTNGAGMRNTPLLVGKGRARAAKTEANAKLDVQAKQLALTQAELKSVGRKKPSREKAPDSPNGRPVLGTRVSRRLRGEVQDEWQPVPAEWLTDGNNNLAERGRTTIKRKGKARDRSSGGEEAMKEEGKLITGLESGDESELTELSDSVSNDHNEDEDMADAPGALSSTSSKQQQASASRHQVEEQDHLQAGKSWPPVDFVEWETICVTLYEWDTIAKQFEDASHYSEKALHRALTQEIVPAVTGMLREIERQRQKEEAIVHRKRSSRIAVKESEKEEARLAAQKKADDDERLARARRMEARAKKEEEERIKRELAREQRRKEREEREERMKARRSQDQESSDVHVDVLSHTQGTSDSPANDVFATSSFPPNSREANGTGTWVKGVAAGEDWELDCEICGAKGVNRDDGVPLLSCGRCSKWQHISCHDAADIRAGRLRRNWDAVDFTCKRCLGKVRTELDSSIHPLIPRGQQQQHEQYVPYVHYGTHSTITPNVQVSSGYNPRTSDTTSKTPQTSRSKLEPRLAINGQKTPASYSEKSTKSQEHQTRHTQGGPSRTVAAAQSSNIVPYQAHTAVTFAHYQPQQRGFSPHVITPQSSEHGYGYVQSSLAVQASPHSNSGSTGQHAMIISDDQGRSSAPYSSHIQPYYNATSHSTYPPRSYPPLHLQGHQTNWTSTASTYPSSAGNFVARATPTARLQSSPERSGTYALSSLPVSDTCATHNGQYSNANLQQQHCVTPATQQFFQSQS